MISLAQNLNLLKMFKIERKNFVNWKASQTHLQFFHTPNIVIAFDYIKLLEIKELKKLSLQVGNPLNFF
jgi:hypothetical protein